MKKTEYAAELLVLSTDKHKELDAEKYDDYDLPQFSKEVPTGSKKQETSGDISIEYDWKRTDSPSIKIKKITFRREEGLSDLYRVAVRDGADSISFRHNNSTYILRKTAYEIAQALYNAYGKIRGALENIVGYLRTILGNDYVLTKVDSESWTFDRRIAKGNITYVDVDSLERNNKRKLCEMITDKIAELHSSNLVIGRFTLNNVLLSDEDLKLSDLRKMRVTRKKSYVIEEFKNILQYLFAIGIATREDVYGSIAYYTAKNEDSCKEWYQEKTGKRVDDAFDITCKMEEEVYS